MHSKHKEFLHKKYSKEINDIGFDNFCNNMIAIQGRAITNSYSAQVVDKDGYLSFMKNILGIEANGDELKDGTYLVGAFHAILLIED